MSEISHLFDLALHTFESVRSSPELFAATMGVAARYKLPDLCQTLLDHANRLIMRSLAIGKATVGIVQALMVLVHWKDPEDHGAYMKIGMAFRAACQLQLGRTIGEPLPASERAARERLDGERLWLCKSQEPYYGSYRDYTRTAADLCSNTR